MTKSLSLKKSIYVLALCFAFSIKSYGQNISNYAVSNETTPAYSAIVGGTPVSIVGSSNEGFQNELPIGFGFWYMGIKHNTFSVSTNGWLILGAAITDASPTNNLTGNRTNPILAPLWDDLAISTATDAGIKYLLTGTAGSRVLTIEWRQMEWPVGSATRLSFQVKLYEFSGEVRFVYTPSVDSGGTRSASIGMTGANQLVSLRVSPFQTSGSERNTVINMPANNTNYRFIPSAPAAPTGLNFTNIGSESVRLNWAAVTANSGYLIYRSREETTGFVQVGEVYGTSVNNYTDIGLDPSVKYYYRVVAVREILSAPVQGDATTNICAQNPSGLIANYKFDGNAYDAVGSTPSKIDGTNPGEFRGASGSFTDDKFGNGAYDPNGTNDFMATTNSYVDPQALTVSIWFKTTTTVGGVLMSFTSDRTGTGTTYSHDRMLYMTPNGKIYFGVYSGSPAAVRTLVTPGSYSDGKWHQVTGVLSSGGMELYMDAVLVGSDASITGAQNFTGFWRVGHSRMNSNWTGWGSGRVQAYFKGALDDVVIYHSALPQAEVQKLYRPRFVTTNTAGTVCAGDPFNLNISDAPGASFAWTGPNGYSSSVQNPPTIILSNATVGEYTVTITTAGGCPIIRSTLVGFNTTNPGLWTGKISTAWDNGDNWCGGVVPTSAINVTIPTSVPSSDVVLTAAMAANDVNVQSGRTLTITGAGDLQVAGAISNAGTINAADGKLTFNGTAAQVIPAGLLVGNSIKNLSISNATLVSLNGPLRLSGTLTPSAGIFQTNGNLTLASTANSTANVATIPADASVTGNVRVERFINGGTQLPFRTFRMLSSPVYTNANPSARTYTLNQFIDNMVVTGTGGGSNGFDAVQSVLPTAFTYNAGFRPVENIAAEIPTGNGVNVFFRGNRTDIIAKITPPFVNPENVVIDFVGELNQQDVVVALLDNGNLVGNPYASSIDWNSTGIIKNGLLGNTLRVWNPANRLYATFDGTVQANGGSNVISSGQGFLIQAEAGVSASLTFTEAAKIATQPDVLLLSAPISDRLTLNNEVSAASDLQVLQAPHTEVRLTLTPKNSIFYEEAVVVFKAGKLGVYSVSEDASYLWDPKEQQVFLSTRSTDHKDLVINYLPEVSATSRVALNINSLNKGGDYDLLINYKDVPAGYLMQLRDNFLSTTVNVQNGDRYPFTIDKNAANTFGADRFSISFEASTTLPVTLTSFTAVKVNEGVSVKWNSATETNHDKFEVERAGDDQVFKKLQTITTKGSGAAYSYLDRTPLLGNNYYRLVQVSNDNKSNTTSPIVINYVKGVKSELIAVFPNPVEDNFTLQFNGVLTGTHPTIKLVSTTGQVMFTKVIARESLNSGIALNVSQYAAGLYIIEVYEAGNQKVGQVKLIKK